MSTDNKSITKSASIIGTATLISRIFGFLRDVIVAWLFGTGVFAQAFVVAFRIPNILRSVVGEGTTKAVIVPILSQYASRRSTKDYWELAGNLLNVILLILIFITIAGIILAPFIVKVIAPGFIKDVGKLSLTIKLTRIMFPYIFFIGLTSVGIGVLNSFKYFTIPALTQVIFNILLIISLLILYFFFNMGVFSLGIGVLIGGFGQVIIQIPSLYKYGFKWQRKVFFIHPAMKRIGKLFVPRLIGAGVYHINILVDTMLASLAYIVGKGGVAALYYANRLVQFPLAIFGIALAQAALPTFSRQSLEKGLDRFKKTLSFSLRSVLFITLPSTIGLIVLRGPIIKILFQRGEFGSYSTNITSYTLLFYVIGLFAYGGIKILVSSFYSLKDTITPVKVASFSVVINIILNLILMWPLKIGGLALATSISATVNFMLLYWLLRRRIGYIYEKDIIRTFFKSLFASVCMGFICYYFYSTYVQYMKLSFIKECIGVILTIGLGTVTYLVICSLIKMSEANKIINFIFSKFGVKNG